MFAYVLGVTELARTESTTNRISRLGIASMAIALILVAVRVFSGNIPWARFCPCFVWPLGSFTLSERLPLEEDLS